MTIFLTVLTGNLDIIDRVTVEEPLSTSDHCRTDIIIKIPISRISLAPRTVYLYSKRDYKNFNREMQCINWDSMLGKKTVNQKWEVFKTEYHRLLDLYVPKKVIKPGHRHKPPWSRFKCVTNAKSKKRKA